MKRGVLTPNKFGAVCFLLWFFAVGVGAQTKTAAAGTPATVASVETPATVAPVETSATNDGPFSLTAQAMALPGGGETVAASDVGATYAITNAISLRSDNILAPSNGVQMYTGGVQWFPNLSGFLAKTKLNPKQFQFYLTGSAGIDRLVPSTGPSQQHIALLAGGGINYSPSSNGVFSVNLAEVRYAHIPGLANSTAIVSSGVNLTF